MDVGNAVHTANCMHHAHCDMVLFRVLCAVRTRLRSQWWFHCTLSFTSRGSNRLKHMGTLSWLNPETLQRVHTPCLANL